MYYAFLEKTPVGRLLVAGDDCGLRHVAFGETWFSSPEIHPEPDWECKPGRLCEPLEQLQAYFAGQLQQFDLQLAPEGTEFQTRVWAALQNVPFGQTCSYGEIAAAVGNPVASRAVGRANGRNPIAIIIPCHRIIGRCGKLVGYGGGLQNKQTLLTLEGIALRPHRRSERQLFSTV